ncbi:MAG: DUF4336 domain-containing protein [Myxococcota bacterium]|nr:DUF4336 domain-containing protein [Myxococcota bacterium]
MLREFGHGLWLAEGPTVRFLGLFPYPTRMAVVRLGDGSLWIWSPIALDDDLEQELATLGPVRHLIAPNKLHHLFLPAWAERFPEARLWASPGLPRKRSDIRFHGVLGNEPEPAWSADVDQLLFGGSFFLDELFFLHRASRTLLVCDLIQRFPRGSIGGWREWMMRLDGLVLPNGSSPRDARASFWRRSDARASRDRALAWKPERMVVAHGECVESEATPVLERGLAWLG